MPSCVQMIKILTETIKLLQRLTTDHKTASGYSRNFFRLSIGFRSFTKTARTIQARVVKSVASHIDASRLIMKQYPGRNKAEGRLPFHSLHECLQPAAIYFHIIIAYYHIFTLCGQHSDLISP